MITEGASFPQLWMTLYASCNFVWSTPDRAASGSFLLEYGQRNVSPSFSPPYTHSLSLSRLNGEQVSNTRAQVFQMIAQSSDSRLMNGFVRIK